jgi:hypothetical protein
MIFSSHPSERKRDNYLETEVGKLTWVNLDRKIMSRRTVRAT